MGRPLRGRRLVLLRTSTSTCNLVLDFPLKRGGIGCDLANKRKRLACVNYKQQNGSGERLEVHQLVVFSYLW